MSEVVGDFARAFLVGLALFAPALGLIAVVYWLVVSLLLMVRKWRGRKNGGASNRAVPSPRRARRPSSQSSRNEPT